MCTPWQTVLPQIEGQVPGWPGRRSSSGARKAIGSIHSRLQVLLLEVELVKGQTENTVAALVDVDRHRTLSGKTQKGTYLRRAAMSFMDDVTVSSYRSTAENVGGWENLQGRMPEWVRLGWRERSQWLVG